MSLTLDCDVLIVGGGPAGLSVASSLSPKLKSVIVHKDSKIGIPVRTSGGSWLNDARELNLPAHLYQIIDYLDFYSDSEKVSFQIKENRPIVFDVTGLYQYLNQLSDKLNRKLLLATTFVETKENDEGGYTTKVRNKEKGCYSIKSKYIVDATGVQCAVLSHLSLVKKPSRIGVGIEYEYEIDDNQKNRAILFVGSSVLSGYGWIFPTPDSKLRVGVGIIRPDTKESLKLIQTNLIQSSSLERFGVKLGKKHKINSGFLPSVVYRDKLVFGKVISTGDNANFATPTVGEGIRFAIKYGRTLGEALNKAILEHNLELLKEYEKDAKKEFKSNYKIGFFLNKKISSYKAKDWDRVLRKLKYFDSDRVTSLLRSEFSFSDISKFAINKIASRVKKSFGY